MKKDFHTIVCPKCRVKQTGYIQESNDLVRMLPFPDHTNEGTSVFWKVPKGTLYILCSNRRCQHLIIDDELATVTEQKIRSIIDFKS